MRVHLIQYAVSDMSKDAAMKKVNSLLQQVHKTDLIILPEVWNIGYHAFDEYEREAEAIDGQTFDAVRSHAVRLQCWLHAGSIVERDTESGKLFNCSIIINPHGEIAAFYRKIHVFGYGSQERLLLCAGSELKVLDTEHGKMAFTCCYDIRFPELYRQLQEAGAEIFCICAAWPAERLEAWRLFCRARAHENLAFVLSCNCAGTSRGQSFAGHSMLVDPMGHVMYEAGSAEEVIEQDIHLEQLSQHRQQYPFLEDRVL